MVSVVSESAVQENTKEEANRTSSASVTHTLSTVNTTSKISSDRSRGKTHLPVCKYAASKQTCPYGSQCRYRHPIQSSSSRSVCRHYLRGDCRYGNGCKFRHPEIRDDFVESPLKEEEKISSVLNVNDFPSVVQSKDVNVRARPDIPKRPHPSGSTKPHPSGPPMPKQQKRILHHHDGSQSAPVELQLEAFFKRAATITPKPAMARPGKKPQENPVNKVLQIEQLELKLLREEHSTAKDSREKSIHLLPFQPSNPEWVRGL